MGIIYLWEHERKADQQRVYRHDRGPHPFTTEDL
nr:MAG TPA: hypothetical protein [Caudoviricetes sp.]